MKKRISLLLCALMLLLSVQSACALTISTMSNVSLGSLSMKDLSTNTSNLTGTSNKLGGQLPKPTSFEKHLDDPPSSVGVTRKALVTDITINNDEDTPVNTDAGFLVSIPMDRIAGAGTVVQNVQVLHSKTGTMEEDDWEKLDAALTKEDLNPVPVDTPSTAPSSSPSTAPSSPPTTSSPIVNIKNYTLPKVYPTNAPVNVTSNLRLCMLTQSLSPFVIVWDEVSLYSDVPQTGDSSASMAWFALLTASCAALLVLRRRFRRA